MNKQCLLILSMIFAITAHAEKEASKNAFINWFGNNKLRTVGVGIAALGFGTESLLTKLEYDRCARKNESMNLDKMKGMNLDNEAFDSVMNKRLQRGWKVRGDVQQDQADARCYFTLERKTRLGKTIKENWTVKTAGLMITKDEATNEIKKLSYPDKGMNTNVFRKRGIEGNITYIPWVKRALIGMGIVSCAYSFWPSK